MAPYRTKPGSSVHLMRTCPRTIGTVAEKRDSSTVVNSGTSRLKQIMSSLFSLFPLSFTLHFVKQMHAGLNSFLSDLVTSWAWYLGS